MMKSDVTRSLVWKPVPKIHEIQDAFAKAFSVGAKPPHARDPRYKQGLARLREVSDLDIRDLDLIVHCLNVSRPFGSAWTIDLEAIESSPGVLDLVQEAMQNLREAAPDPVRESVLLGPWQEHNEAEGKFKEELGYCIFPLRENIRNLIDPLVSSWEPLPEVDQIRECFVMALSVEAVPPPGERGSYEEGLALLRRASDLDIRDLDLILHCLDVRGPYAPPRAIDLDSIESSPEVLELVQEAMQALREAAPGPVREKAFLGTTEKHKEEYHFRYALAWRILPLRESIAELIDNDSTEG